MSQRPGRLSAVTAPRLAGLAVDVGDHSVATTRLFGALGLTVATVDECTEIRCDNGMVVRLTRSTTPTRIGLRFAVGDIITAVRALDEHGGHTTWAVHAPNVIRVERGDLTVDVTEAETPSLAAVTLFVADVAETARFYAALGLPTTDATPAAVADPNDPPEPQADVRLAGVTIQLRAAGLGPATAFAQMVIRADDPMSCTVGLDCLKWEYAWDADSLVTRTPDGSGVRVTPVLL